MSGGEAGGTSAWSWLPARLDRDDPAHDGPHVTIATPTRDGLGYLQQLLAGLDATAYRNFDLVVIDNDSGDDTVDWLQERNDDRIHVVRNDHNETFSHANNQALEIADGELFLALNNDIEPLHPDWLTHLVVALEAPDVAAAGAVLVQPKVADGEEAEGTHPDAMMVQHAGVAFMLDEDRVRAINLGAGDDPADHVGSGTRPVAALTAACMLARTSDLRSLGGFDQAYVYGSEDWDLSLRLAGRGQLVLVQDAVLLHREMGTQVHEAREDRVSRHRANHTVFNRRWGAAVRRSLLLERITVGGLPGVSGGQSGELFGPPRRPRVRLAVEQADTARLRADFEQDGWDVVDASASRARADMGLYDAGRLPQRRPNDSLSAVWGRGIPTELPDWVDLVVRPVGSMWAHDAPAVTIEVASSIIGSTDFRAATARFVARPRVAVRASPPNWEKAPVWGDTHYAQSFATALRQAGLPAQVQVVSDFEEPWANAFDIVVHLRGLANHPVCPGAINVLWVISHPELVSDDELAEHDLVLVASTVFADHLRTRTTTRVEVAWQATDIMSFRPVPRDQPRSAHGIVSVAAPRWPSRRSVQWLRELGWEFTLHGPYWSTRMHGIEADVGFVPNDELVHVYGDADIVVADQWDHMANEGFVANRLFDVLAAGGFVISDEGPGVTEVFGDLVPTYASRDDLDRLLQRYADDGAARNALIARAMGHVRREHSFDVRARQLLALLDIPVQPWNH